VHEIVGRSARASEYVIVLDVAAPEQLLEVYVLKTQFWPVTTATNVKQSKKRNMMEQGNRRKK